MTNNKSLEQRLCGIIQNNSPQKIELAIHTILIKLDNNEPFDEDLKSEIKQLLKSALPHVSEIVKYIESAKRKGDL